MALPVLYLWAWYLSLSSFDFLRAKMRKSRRGTVAGGIAGRGKRRADTAGAADCLPGNADVFYGYGVAADLSADRAGVQSFLHRLLSGGAGFNRGPGGRVYAQYCKKNTGKRLSDHRVLLLWHRLSSVFSVGPCGCFVDRGIFRRTGIWLFHAVV